MICPRRFQSFRTATEAITAAACFPPESCRCHDAFWIQSEVAVPLPSCALTCLQPWCSACTLLASMILKVRLICLLAGTTEHPDASKPAILQTEGHDGPSPVHQCMDTPGEPPALQPSDQQCHS